MDKVLIITSKADAHADYVIEKMNARKIKMARLNTDEIENLLFVTYTINSGHEVKGEVGHIPSLLFRGEEIQSVWYRKPFMSKYDRTAQKPEVAFAGRETEAYLLDVCECLKKKKWINWPEANHLADNKLRQLRLAKNLGFRVPETIVSNNPAEVLNFAHRLAPKKLIYKTLSHPFISETATKFRSVYATLIDLSSQVLQSIRPVPCLIQEYVDKAYELRITVVGNRLFAAKIFSQEHAQTKIDWRRDQDKIQLRHELVEIEETAKLACVQMTRNLNLVFGAIDMIVTPEGEYVFLEINPNGQWAWIEIALGAPISEALINELIS